MTSRNNLLRDFIVASKAFACDIPIARVRIPVINWIRTYTTDDFVNDCVAGVTVFALLIPQGLAYSLLAGMPPVYGLYAATFPIFIYFVFGTSRQISMGPMSLSCLLLGQSALSLGYSPGTSEYIDVVMNMSLITGVVMLSLGVFKLGILSNLLCRSVLSGFLVASALIIALSQLKYIFGLHVPHFNYTVQTFGYILIHLPESNKYAVLIGFMSWILLYAVKLWRQKEKTAHKNSSPSNVQKYLGILSNASSLLTIILGSCISYAIVSSGGDLRIVGTVPAGILKPGFRFVSFPTMVSLMPSGFIIGIVSFAGNWAIAKKFAAINNYEVDATQELIATGLANTIGVFFNAFVVSGGLARSAVNAESGAKTQISGCISAILIILALLFFTSIFYYIPMAILGAIIEVSVASMIDFDDMFKAYRVNKRDFVVMVSTFLATLFIGISEGILVGVVMSITFMLTVAEKPQYVFLGRSDAYHGGYLNISRFPDARQIARIVIMRVDTNLYFANASSFRDEVYAAAEGKFHTSSEDIEFLILEVSAWNDIDLMGVEILNEIHGELLKRGIQFSIAGAKQWVEDRIRTAKFASKLGSSCLTGSIEAAMEVYPSRRRNLEEEIEMFPEVQQSLSNLLHVAQIRGLSNTEIELMEVEQNPLVEGWQNDNELLNIENGPDSIHKNSNPNADERENKNNFIGDNR